MGSINQIQICQNQREGLNSHQKGSEAIMPCSLLSMRVQEASENTGNPVACTSCGVQVHSIYTDIDHAVPKFLGGQNDGNTQRLCLNCHRGKSLYENCYIQPLKQEMKVMLDKLRAHGVVTLHASSFECAGRAIGSCIEGFNILKARRVMEQHFTHKQTPKTQQNQKHNKKRARTVTTHLNKWTTRDDELLMTLCFGRQKHLTRHSQLLSKWKKIQANFNRQAQHRRSVPALKRRVQSLRTSPH
jgi:hypothetical protein